MSMLDAMFQQFAAPTLRHWFGVTVTICRGQRETPNVVATWSKPPGEVDLEVMPMKLTHRVYRIPVASYQINGEVVKPQRSDRIREVIQGNTCEFEILPDDSSTDISTDGDGHDWIIRTKQVD